MDPVYNTRDLVGGSWIKTKADIAADIKHLTYNPNDSTNICTFYEGITIHQLMVHVT